MKNLLQQAHWLSLDVMLGAVLCNIVFWKLPDGHGQTEYLSAIILGIAVFIVYSSDRLFDLRKQNLSDTLRHKFHEKHKKLLWEIIIILTIFSTIFAMTLPHKVLQMGIAISAIVFLYLIIVNRLPNHSSVLVAKEPLTAFIYTMGTVGTAFVNRTNISQLEWTIALIFFLIVIQNLLLFSMYESMAKPSAINMANYIGKNRVRGINTVIFITILAIGGYAFSQNRVDYIAKILLVQIIMSAILWMLNDFVKFFIQEERYRWLGDGVFLLMLVLIF
jgi:hypothetical protein